jgi:hypothetical protein
VTSPARGPPTRRTDYVGPHNQAVGRMDNDPPSWFRSSHSGQLTASPAGPKPKPDAPLPDAVTTRRHLLLFTRDRSDAASASRAFPASPTDT